MFKASDSPSRSTRTGAFILKITESYNEKNVHKIEYLGHPCSTEQRIMTFPPLPLSLPDLKSTSSQDSGTLVLGHIRGGGTILFGNSLGREGNVGRLVEFYLLLLVETLQVQATRGLILSVKELSKGLSPTGCLVRVWAWNIFKHTSSPSSWASVSISASSSTSGSALLFQMKRTRCSTQDRRWG